MKSFVVMYIKKFLGGGASYVVFGMITLLLIQYWQISNLKNDHIKVLEERDRALAKITEKDTVIASQARQYDRQINSRKDEEDAQKTINSVPNSDTCIHSPAIGNALDWLRERESRTAENDNDKSNVRMSDKTGHSE